MLFPHIAIDFVFVLDVGPQSRKSTKSKGIDRPGGFWEVEAPRQSAYEFGKFVRPIHRLPSSPKKYSWY